MNKFIFLLTIIISWSVNINAAVSDKLLEDGKYWEYDIEVNSKITTVRYVVEGDTVLPEYRLGKYSKVMRYTLNSGNINNGNLAGLLYNIGKRIYFIPRENDPEGWLLYDFNIKVGESRRIGDYNFDLNYKNGRLYHQTFFIVNCVDSFNIEICGITYNVKELEVYNERDEVSEYDPETTYWIDGIGSVKGLMASEILKVASIGPENQYKSHPYRVYQDGNLIYDNTELWNRLCGNNSEDTNDNSESGIKILNNSDSDIPSDIKYHINGSLFREGDTGLCIENGQIIIK